MNEKLIEKKLRLGVKKLGGTALKFTSPGVTGVPDRIVLMPGGKMYFVEIKTTGKTLKPRQIVVVAQLRKMGFAVWLIDTQEVLDAYLHVLKTLE